MQSIRKIGILVLKRAFPQKELKKFWRTTYVMDGAWPLKWKPENDGNFSIGDWQFDYGYIFSVWGIELGLIHLTPKEKDQTIEEMILCNDEIKQRKFLPTHIAKTYWNLEGGIRKEQVDIYSISKDDITSLKNKIQD